ncbi:MAG: rRNA maturation RNase YbeY [Alphaproteobacteria bacterium]|nr:rRNA maturation RNase YbeY [Alphaproteobacteria bacterium]
MNSFEVFLTVDDSRWTTAIEKIAVVTENVKNAVVETVFSEVEYLHLAKDFTVNLCLSDDDTVHKLNLEFRGMDKPTNVLSFANIDGDDFEDALDHENVIEMGDIIIAYETMQEQSKEQEISLEHHFCHLWAHGLLHLLGYDHIDENDRIEMEQLETLILEKLGIKNPYRE